MRAALKGESLINSKFQEKNIHIAFNPITEEFKTLNSAIKKDPHWIPDIKIFFTDEYRSYKFIPEYTKKNNCDPDIISQTLEKVKNIENNAIGNIILSSSLEIDAVTEIFNRINSQGTELNSADFIMSKLSADTDHRGSDLRKTVEYFTKLLLDPNVLKNIKDTDHDFVRTEFFPVITWIAKEHDNLYQPNFGDIFHVVLGFEFGRGRHSDLVSLVSGRDFERKAYTEEAMVVAYEKLQTGILAVVNESNFKRYTMILKSLGMISHKALSLNGMGVLNFGYSLYLLLQREMPGIKNNSKIETIVKKWVIMSALTRRYSGSSETKSGQDIQLFLTGDPQKVLNEQIEQNLSDSFWNVTLPEYFDTSSTQSNVWRVFVMSQVRNGDNAWLEKDHTVKSLVELQGNVHHIFPKAYLRKHGYSQKMYNQIANYTWLTQPRNLQAGDQAPKDYLSNSTVVEYRTSQNDVDNAIPQEVTAADFQNYETFLKHRRRLMSAQLRQYFNSL